MEDSKEASSNKRKRADPEATSMTAMTAVDTFINDMEKLIAEIGVQSRVNRDSAADLGVNLARFFDVLRRAKDAPIAAKHQVPVDDLLQVAEILSDNDETYSSLPWHKRVCERLFDGTYRPRGLQEQPATVELD
jgi:hypothetical protein